MEKYGRYGHRQRMRNNFLANGVNGMADANIMELYLSLIIPQKDVKQTSYDVLNKFDGLENVFRANADELQEVKGIGPITSKIIKLSSKYIFDELVDNSFRLDTIKNQIDYAKSLDLTDETAVIFLSQDKTYLNTSKYKSDDINNPKVTAELLGDAMTFKADNFVLVRKSESAVSSLSYKDIDTIKILTQ